jgi:hypothetical protein
MPGIFPIQIPVFLDPQARAKDEGVEVLVREIQASDPNSVIIVNGVKTNNNVYTFQGMKGRNGLETSNLYIILT